jgi:hypothetical protein
MILNRAERTTLIWIGFGHANDRPPRAVRRADVFERCA